MSDSTFQSLQLHPLSPIYRMSVGTIAHRPRQRESRKKEISHDAVYYHFRKWSRDGSLEKVWYGSIHTIHDSLNLSELNLDGTHVVAKKGGESVAYQRRKKAKSTNILPVTDGHGFFLATTDLSLIHI